MTIAKPSKKPTVGEIYDDFTKVTFEGWNEKDFAEVIKAGLRELKKGREKGDVALIRFEASMMLVLGMDKYEVSHKIGKSIKWVNEVSGMRHDERIKGWIDLRSVKGDLPNNFTEVVNFVGRGDRLLPAVDFVRLLGSSQSALPVSVRNPNSYNYLSAVLRVAERIEKRNKIKGGSK